MRRRDALLSLPPPTPEAQAPTPPEVSASQLIARDVLNLSLNGKTTASTASSLFSSEHAASGTDGILAESTPKKSEPVRVIIEECKSNPSLGPFSKVNLISCHEYSETKHRLSHFTFRIPRGFVLFHRLHGPLLGTREFWNCQGGWSSGNGIRTATGRKGRQIQRRARCGRSQARELHIQFGVSRQDVQFYLSGF